MSHRFSCRVVTLSMRRRFPALRREVAGTGYQMNRSTEVVARVSEDIPVKPTAVSVCCEVFVSFPIESLEVA